MTRGTLTVAGAAMMAVAIVGAAGWTFSRPVQDAPKPADLPVVKDKVEIGRYVIPSDNAIAGDSRASILLGKRLLEETARLLPANTGAALNCNSCHLGGGKLPNGLSYINTARNYPSDNARAGRVITLEERINGCFMRSMNGKPLDPQSAEMKAMTAYIGWLSADLPDGAKVKVASLPAIDKTLKPDPVRGAGIYAAQCASCHGASGEGLRDSRGDVVFPPLWGEASFNIGAGMARTFTAAAFVKANMPIGVNESGRLGQGGTLSDQDALDVAEYFTHMPRPDFAAKTNDWPKGKKPPDARY